MSINLITNEDSLSENFTLSVMNWSEDSVVEGVDNFEINKDILFSVNGKLRTDYWSYLIENNQLLINVSAVSEPAEWAAILGGIALGFAVYRKRK